MIRLLSAAAVVLILLAVFPVHMAQSSETGGLWVVPVENCGYAPALRSLIDNATTSVYISMNVISDYFPVRVLLDSLVNAHKRGVDVKVLYEKNITTNKYAAEYLENGGVQVKGDSSNLFLHTKLVVIDGKTVYVGSHNWSPYAMEKNNEYGVIIFNSTLGAFFYRYFQSLWNDANSTPLLTNVAVESHGLSVKTTYDGYTYSAINSLIRSATYRLDVALYTMAYYYNPDGNEELVDNLVNDVVEKKSIAKVILDDHDSKYAYNYLKNDSGVDVVYDSSSNITHLKMVIADDTVYIGDANWDYGYLDNDTHTVGVVIHNRSIADFFAGYFETIYRYGDTPYYIPDGFIGTGDMVIQAGKTQALRLWLANGGQKNYTTVHIITGGNITASVPGNITWHRDSVYDWKELQVNITAPDTPGNYLLSIGFYSRYYHINYTFYLTVHVSAPVPELNLFFLAPLLLLGVEEHIYRKKRRN